MKLVDIYNIAVKKGMEKDPRSRAEIKAFLGKARKEYRKLKGADKRCFDKERLTNPYSDTRILYGSKNQDVRTIMAGIDMEAPELLLADRLNATGRRSIDLVLAHHPEGAAWARLYDVMGLQANTLNRFGIPLDVGERLLKDRSEEVSRALSAANHFRSVDAARLLDIPFMCIHTPADNHVFSYLHKIFDTKKPGTLAQAVGILKGIPEYADAMKKDAGPRIISGEPKSKAGRILVDMTGGTEGSKKVYARLSQAGVGTIAAMHLSEEHYKNAREEGINVIIAGHIASDALGLNLLLDSLEAKSKLEIIPCSGFIRVKR